MCIDSNQCEDEMICVGDNTTKSTGFNRNTNSQAPPVQKICLCDEENGFTEDVQDNRCNGKVFFYCFHLLILLFSYFIFYN